MARDIDIQQHDEALAKLRQTLQLAKAQALDVASRHANHWAEGIVHAVERAEFEVRWYMTVEEKRREDDRQKSEGTR